MTHDKRKAIYLATKLGDKVADWISDFIGSWPCVFLHALWFAAWFALGLDINLLTLVVSLEAIFLCIFLLMSQNRQGDRDRARDSIEADEISVMYDQSQQLYTINQRQLEILELLHTRQKRKGDRVERTVSSHSDGELSRKGE